MSNNINISAREFFSTYAKKNKDIKMNGFHRVLWSNLYFEGFFCNNVPIGQMKCLSEDGSEINIFSFKGSDTEIGFAIKKRQGC